MKWRVILEVARVLAAVLAGLGASQVSAPSAADVAAAMGAIETPGLVGPSE